jgi:hypothetical protein
MVSFRRQAFAVTHGLGDGNRFEPDPMSCFSNQEDSTMRCMNIRIMIACMAMFLSATTTVSAEPIALDVANPGFDADSLAGNPDGYALGAPTGWTMYAGGAGYQLGTSADLVARSGANWGFLSPGIQYADGDALGQLLTTNGSVLNVTSGGSITINVYQGHRVGYQADSTQTFSIEIWRDHVGTSAGGTLVGDSGDFGNVPSGVASWTLRSYTYAATSADVGKNLIFRLYNPGPSQVQLEDVSATYTAAPEPSVMALLATGMIGLLAYAWRKRK